MLAFEKLPIKKLAFEELSAGPGNPAPNRTDRNSQQLCGFVVRKAEHLGERERFAPVGVQVGQHLLQLHGGFRLG